MLLTVGHRILRSEGKEGKGREYGRTLDSFALSKISKPGKLNPMFGKVHSIETKLKMSLSKSKVPVGLYDINNNLIKTFSNQVELSNFLKLSKSRSQSE